MFFVSLTTSREKLPSLHIFLSFVSTHAVLQLFDETWSVARERAVFWGLKNSQFVINSCHDWWKIFFYGEIKMLTSRKALGNLISVGSLLNHRSFRRNPHSWAFRTSPWLTPNIFSRFTSIFLFLRFHRLPSLIAFCFHFSLGIIIFL